MDAISVRGLTKTYGGFTAVDDLSFSVEEGETFALLGPNGAGKTTTIEILEGLRERDSGDVTVLGRDPSGRDIGLQREMGVMLQDGGLYPGAKAREIIDLYGAFYPNPRLTAELLDLVGLSDKAGIQQKRLSGGERQRLALATALVGRPKLIFIDEPTSGMDVAGRHATWEIIRDLKAQGVTVILTTHYMEEAEQLADRVGIVSGGRLLALGAPEVLTAGRRGVRFKSTDPLDSGALSQAVGFEVVALPDGGFSIDVEATPFLLARLAAWAESAGVLLTEIRVGAGGLEEVFLELTAEDET
jgi:ABC-2 type transport system ATP-binding protein